MPQGRRIRPPMPTAEQFRPTPGRPNLYPPRARLNPNAAPRRRSSSHRLVAAAAARQARGGSVDPTAQLTLPVDERGDHRDAGRHRTLETREAAFRRELYATRAGTSPSVRSATDSHYDERPTGQPYRGAPDRAVCAPHREVAIAGSPTTDWSSGAASSTVTIGASLHSSTSRRQCASNGRVGPRVTWAVVGRYWLARSLILMGW